MNLNSPCMCIIIRFELIFSIDYAYIHNTQFIRSLEGNNYVVGEHRLQPLNPNPHYVNFRRYSANKKLVMPLNKLLLLTCPKKVLA